MNASVLAPTFLSSWGPALHAEHHACAACRSSRSVWGGGGAGAALGVLWAGGFGAVAFNVYKLQNGEE
jgi:hypothetical protein